MSDRQNRVTAKRKSDLFITSIIADKIGRHEVLLPINYIMTQVEKQTSHLPYFFREKTTVTSAKCATTAYTQDPYHPIIQARRIGCPIILSNYTVQLQARGVHCPIKAQFGMVIINHVRELSCSFDDFQPQTRVSQIGL